MSHPEDDVHDDNVRFLRTRQAPSRSGLSATRAAVARPNSYEDEMNSILDVVEGRRPRHSAVPPRRIPIVRRQREGFPEGGPNPDGALNLPSPYGWAPAPEDDEEGDNDDSLSNLVEEMWYARQPPGHDNGRQSSGSRLPRREPGGPGRTRAEERTLEPYISSIRNGGATAALLESVRRHSRLARGARPYIPDSTHGTQDQESERSFRSNHYLNNLGASQERTPHRTAASRANPQRPSDVRRMYLKDPSVDRLKEAIQYLDQVRFSSSYEESLSKASIGGFVHLEYFLRNEDDFILNTGSIPGPAMCSWLQPGAVFSGVQQATHYAATPTHSTRTTATANRITDPVIVNGSDTNRISVQTSSGSRYWARNSVDLGEGGTQQPQQQQQQVTDSKTEQWPVKVTIHNVDYDTMKLSGTMEASDIPDKSATNQTAHIVTYLEGEIIDFNTHALETKNFSAGPEVDSLYWRELEPFKDMTPDDIVKNLVSKKWVTEQLARGWILMRWKERCFVSPSHSRQGLTISGFYYASIRRDNGHIEGMYYDPGSTPFQKLTLDPQLKERMVFPAYEFR